MKTYLDCLPCFLRQSLEASRMATDDEELQKDVLLEVMKKLRYMNLEGMKPPDIADKVHKTVRRVTGNEDPYKDLKDEFNQKAMEMYEELRYRAEGSEDKLMAATKMAIAGNIIDFGVSSEFDLEKTIEETLKSDFKIDRYGEFRKQLERAEDVVYLADNAGEIVFDKLLLDQIKDKNITFVVKGGPIINDAMIEDAEEVGIDLYADLEIVGNGCPGTGPQRDSEEFKDWMRGKDMIISKGQGNYEALSEADLNIFFLLKAKCPVIAKDLGVEVGDIVIA